MCEWMGDKGICIEGNLVFAFNSELEKKKSEYMFIDRHMSVRDVLTTSHR